MCVIMEKRVLCLVLGLCLIACAASSVTPDDPDGDYEVPQTKFRDKRTLDFILRGLANILGYRVEKDNGGAKPTAAAIAAKPTTRPTATTTATPTKVLVLNIADIVEKTRKNNAAKATTPSPKPCKQEYHNYHYNIQSTEKPHFETYNRLQTYSYTADVPTKGNFEEYKTYGYTLDPEAKNKPHHGDTQDSYKHFEGEGDHREVIHHDEDYDTKEREGRRPSHIQKDDPEKPHAHNRNMHHNKVKTPFYAGHNDEGQKPASDERHHSHGYYGYQDDDDEDEDDNRGQYKQDKPNRHEDHKDKQKAANSEKDTSERYNIHDSDESRKPAHSEKETSERHHNHGHHNEPGNTGVHHNSEKHHIHGYNVHLEHDGYPEHVVHFKVDIPYYGHDYSTHSQNDKHRQLLRDEHRAPEDDYVNKKTAIRGEEDQQDKREHYDHPSDSYGNLRWGQEAFFRDKEADKGNAQVLDDYNVIPGDFWGGNWLEGYSFGVQEHPKSTTRVSEKESSRSVTTVSGIVITERGPKKKHRDNEEEQYTTTMSGADGEPTTTAMYQEGRTTTLSREEYRDSPTDAPEKIMLPGTEPSPMPVLSTYRPKLVQTLHEGTGNLLPPSPFDDEHAGRHGGGDFSVVGKLTRASQNVVASPLPFLVSVYNRSSISNLILDNKPKQGFVGLAIPNSKPEAAIEHPDAPPEPSFYGVVLPRKWLQNPPKRTPEKLVVQEKSNTTKTASVGLGVRVQVNKSRELPPSLIRITQGLGNRPAYRDALDIPVDELRYPGRETQHVVAVQSPTPVAIPYHPTPLAQNEFQAHSSNSEFLRKLHFPYQRAAPTPSSPQEYQIQSHHPNGNPDFLRALQLPYHSAPPTQSSQQQFHLVVPDHHQHADQPFRIVFSS